MTNYKLILTLNISIFIITSAFTQGVILNEIMSDNESYVEDESGNMNDWIEIYNPTENDISLEGYYLSDDKDNLLKWEFPFIEIRSEEYMIIYASGENWYSDSEMHTNFKIKSDGEDVILTKEGVIEDEIYVPLLEENYSYGRDPNMSTSWMVMSIPTPLELNRKSKKLDASLSSGFYDGNQQLFIEGAGASKIHYTLNGSIPTSSSLIFEQGSLINYINEKDNYFCDFPTTAPGELITNQEWIKPTSQMNIGYVMKYASFEDDVLTSKVESKFFFISSDNATNFNLPVISIIVDEEGFFGDSLGLYVPGNSYDSNDPVWTGNFFMTGKEWEREAHFTYFDENKELKVEQNIGIRIHGGKTRNAAQKSLRLYARSEYGKSQLEYDFLPNTESSKFKRLILRTTMGPWGGEIVFKDEFAQSSISHLNVYTQDYRPVIVLINGEYWGIHSIRDRMDEEYLSYKLGLSPEDFEMNEWENSDFTELQEYVMDNDLSNSIHFEYVSDRLDISSFIDYNIVQMYYGNYDWPANNNRWWREKNGKWKNVLFDLDATFTDYNYNMIIHNTNDDPELSGPNNTRATLFFRSLVKNESFVDAFLDRYVYLLENTFNPERLISRLDVIKSEYFLEMEGHIERWSYPESMDKLNYDINTQLVEFILKRPCVVKDQLESFFNIELQYDCPSIEEEGESEENQKKLLDNIFPNPVNDILSITFSKLKCQLCNIEIRNALGQLVFKKESTQFIENRHDLDISHINLISGIYFVTVFDSNDELKTLKFIKQ